MADQSTPQDAKKKEETTDPVPATTPNPVTMPAPNPENPAAPIDPTKDAKPAGDQAQLLEALGFSSVSELKEKLGKLQEIEDANKSELDKVKDLTTKQQEALKKYEDQVFTLSAEKAALSADVNKDYVADVITLAKAQVTKDVDITKAIVNVLEKYPHFKKGGTVDPASMPKFSTGDHKQKVQSDQDKWNQAFKTIFSLK